MARLSAKPIVLSIEETASLSALVRAHNTPQQISLRAKIVLKAGEGKGHGEICRELSIGKQMSRRWRNRWLETQGRGLSAAERLKDAPRPGTPATFTLEQITQLYGLACAPPAQYDRPISHWSPRELADELIKQGIVDSISPRHVSRLLDEADLKPHQSSYWLHPPRPQTLRLK